MKKNEKGFSTVELLLVLIVVVLIAAVGWLVWDRQKSKPTKTQTSTASDTTKADSSQNLEDAATTTSAQGSLELTEWHVKVPVSNSPVWTATYHQDDGTYCLISTLGYPPKWGDGCLAVVGRYKPGSSLEGRGNYETKVQLGDYYYQFDAFYSGPASTASETAILNALQQFSEDFKGITVD